jgi:predicted dehydrogenase
MSFVAAVIGARRRRQGIGAHVARWLARHGVRVAAVVGTTPGTVEEARAGLVAAGTPVERGYTSVADLLRGEPDLNLVAVCSPIAAHREALEAVADARVHVLCEKPVLYDMKTDMGATVRALAGRIAASGRLFDTITQWPCTLAGFRRLYPDLELGRMERFRMRLSPTSGGEAMIVDSLPHPLSMLRAIVGIGRARDASVSWESDEAGVLRFTYEHARGSVATELEMRRWEHQPRPAWYEIDGRLARRDVRLPGYTMELVDGDRHVAIEDPLERLVADFVERARRGERPDAEGLAADAAALQAIMKEVS